MKKKHLLIILLSIGLLTLTGCQGVENWFKNDQGGMDWFRDDGSHL